MSTVTHDNPPAFEVDVSGLAVAAQEDARQWRTLDADLRTLLSDLPNMLGRGHTPGEFAAACKRAQHLHATAICHGLMAMQALTDAAGIKDMQIGKQGNAPQWLRALLKEAAEAIATTGRVTGQGVVFRSTPAARQGRFLARLVADPMSAELRLMVSHKPTGRYVCQSLPVALDHLDTSAWATDF